MQDSTPALPTRTDLTLPAWPRRKSVLALACFAMEEELHPVYDYVRAGGQSTPVGGGEMQLVAVADQTLALVRTGIGLVNAACALSRALSLVAPRYIFSLGSAGGLGREVKVGQVWAGSRHLYASADARAFGYELGQIPQMPPSYPGDRVLIDRLASSGIDVRVTEFLSSDSFISASLADEVLASFPQAGVVDMESAALAQVAFLHEVAFLALRGVSDLCTPSAAADNHRKASAVSESAWRAMLQLLGLVDPD